jgi:mRNA interferase RelE/StbE
LRKIQSGDDRNLIMGEVAKLKNFPDCKSIKAIVNIDNLYRLKVKSWRVFFTDQLEIIAIEEVKKRNERTYK